MAFHLKNASCVVLGTFNMYIIHPRWLAKHEIIDKGVEVGIQTNLTEPGFRFLFPQHKTTWTVAPDRIVIESDDPTIDCGALVAAVLRKLPETPFRAIGNNTVYEADRAETTALTQSLRDFLQTGSPPSGETVLQHSFSVAARLGEQREANLQMSVEQDRLELGCNVQTELRGLEDTAVACQAAERFFQDRSAIEPLVLHFFGARIGHGASNA